MPDTLVVCYHNIVADDLAPELLEASLAVSADGFARQLRVLLKGRRPVTFDEIEQKKTAAPALVLTFDDGYEGVQRHVHHLLVRHRVPAYVFVNPAFVGAYSPRDKLMALAVYGPADAVRQVEALLGVTMGVTDTRQRARRFVLWRGPMWRALAARGAEAFEQIDDLFARFADTALMRALEPSRLLSWNALAALQQDGIRIANHTHRHLELDSLPREVIRAEVRQAQQALRRHLGCDEPVISYPRGKVTKTVLDEARAAGYRWGLTATPGRLRTAQPSLLVPRILVSPQPGIRQLLWETSTVRLWARTLRHGRAVPAAS